MAFNTTNSGSFPAPPRDFRLGLSAKWIAVTAGQTATANVFISRFGAFNDMVTFSCAGLPADTACTFSPQAVSPAADGHATVTLTISTKAVSTGALRGWSQGGRTFAFLLPVVGTVLACFGRRSGKMLAFFVVIAGGLLWLQACGGNASLATTATPPAAAPPAAAPPTLPTPSPTPAPAPTGTPHGTYAMTVVATGGGTPTLVRSESVLLTVQ